jgi:hypothetical protein
VGERTPAEYLSLWKCGGHRAGALQRAPCRRAGGRVPGAADRVAVRVHPMGTHRGVGDRVY